MRIIGTLATLLALTFATPAAALPHNPSRWGLGFMVGDPTAFSVKHWFGGPNAIDFALGSGPGLRFHADYLFGLARLASERSMNLDLYLGVGGLVGEARGRCGWIHDHHWCHDHGDAFAAVRVPFGLDFVFRTAPVELGLELAPGMWVAPDVDIGLIDAALFVRLLL